MQQNTEKKDRKPNPRRQPKVVENDGLDKKLVDVNRVTKVVKNNAFFSIGCCW